MTYFHWLKNAQDKETYLSFIVQKHLTAFSWRKNSIVDVWQGPEYASEMYVKTY